MALSSIRPNTSPDFTVMALFTMIWGGFREPLPWVGSTVRRNRGASIRGLDSSKTVAVAWAHE